VLYGVRDLAKAVNLLHYFRVRKAWEAKERVASADVVLLKERRHVTQAVSSRSCTKSGAKGCRRHRSDANSGASSATSQGCFSNDDMWLIARGLY